MNETKKFPVSISFGEYKTKSNEFLVPNPSYDLSLIGTKTGKKYMYGSISYIGLEISTKDIISKMKKSKINISDEERYIGILSKYIDEIYKFKIGNIIEIISNEDGNITLNKVANRAQKQID